MRTSTLPLSILLAGAVGYAAFLQLELSRLKKQGAIVAAPPSERLDMISEKTAAGVPVLDESKTGAVASEEEGEERVSGGEWRERRRERMAAIFDNPEMRLDMVERQMSRIDSSYAGFFRSLDLGPDEIEVLRTLMAEQNIIGWESRMRSSSARTDAERAEAEAAARQQREVLAAEIDKLLRDEGAAALQDYRDSLPYRREVEALASSLSYGEAPLSPEQSELLVQKLQTVSTDHRFTNDLSRIGRGGSVDLSAEDVDLHFKERREHDALVVDAAAEALNEQQLAAFAEKQVAEREREERRVRFMLENGGGFGGWRP